MIKISVRFNIRGMTFAHTLYHFVFPRHTNNFKAKLLHSSSIFLIAVFLIVYQLILNAVPFTGLKILGYAANIPPSEVVRITNEKRALEGVPALKYSSVLEQAARAKGEDMLANDYWAHVAPDGTEPWVFFTSAGYSYRYAGENLARDFTNPSSAVDAWLASPSHRENLLSKKYREIGVAVVEGDLAGVDTTIIVQLFGTALGDTSEQIPVAQAQAPTPTPTTAPTLTPSVTQAPTPTQVPVIAQVSPVPPAGVSGQPAAEPSAFQVLISPFQTTRDISVAVTLILLGVLVIDGVVVARRNIKRIGGRTFAHLAFLGMVLVIILIARAGQIL